MLHYGNNKPNFEYTLCDHVLSPADSANDLNIIRATNLIYDEHCTNIICRANSTCACIIRNFASRNASFMSRIFFFAYIRSVLKYASQLWSPSTVNFINCTERVQRMLTKRICSISHRTYVNLNLILYTYPHMIFLYKIPLYITTALYLCLLRSNHKSFYFFTVHSERLWNSMHHDVTSARNFCTSPSFA